MVSNQEVYFHVGLGKVASTFLQYRVFPYFKGVEYIQRTKYKHFRKILAAKKDSPKLLFSREFDQQLFIETEAFVKHCPNAKIIILLRRHDSWIASQYRRHVKNGNFRSFKQFFDIDENKGLWKQHEMDFYPKLLKLEEMFGSKPLVLFHGDLKKEGFGFIDRLANHMDATYNQSSINMNPKHRSYNERQLKFMRSVGKAIFGIDQWNIKNRVLRWIRRRIRLLTCYFILYLGLILPERKEDLIPKEELEKIKTHYSDDWDKCKAYASE